MRLLRMVSVLLIVIVPALAADNPFTDTWKLNLAKSRLLPGDTTKATYTAPLPAKAQSELPST